MSGLNRKMRRAQGAVRDEAALPDIAAMGAEMVGKALKVLEKIIDDEGATPATRLRAISILFERVYGRPKAAAKPLKAPQTVNLVSTVPDLTVEQWIEKHGVGRAGGTAAGGDRG